jgi:hypothetical protein
MSDLSLQVFAETVTVNPWLSAAPASVVLQLIALVRLRGVFHSLNLILAAMALAVYALAVAAYVLAPGNVWLLMLQLAGPPVLVLTVGILIMGLLVSPNPSRAQ